MKGVNLAEESLHLGLHCCVGLIGGCEFSYMLGGGGCMFVLLDLEAHHHLIHDGVGFAEDQFVNRSTNLSELKVSFSEGRV